jgi:Zn-dependent M28 family amino/carboxypeptidase
VKYIGFAIAIILFSCKVDKESNSSIEISTLEYDIQVLSSDSLLGRAPLTLGEDKTLNYLVHRMKQIGLQPAFNGSYLQEVPLVEIQTQVPEELVFGSKSSSISFSIGKSFTLWSSSLVESISIQNSELIFCGYGISSPEWNWNDFDGIDLNGKTIVVLVNDPGFHTSNTNLFKGREMTYYGRWTYKFEEANKQGAVGCIIIHEDEAAGYPWAVVNRRTNSSEIYLNSQSLKEQTCHLNGWLTQSAATELFEFCGMNYETMKAKASESGFKPIPMDVSYSISLKNSWKEDISYNVGGVLHGSVRPNEALVYTAHWDHLGVGVPIDGDSIYNGASDNAAAVAWMLSIAQAFKNLEKPTERSILFLSPTAEEAGLIGSHYYAQNPVFEHSKTAACFNSDVIMFLGRFKDVTITGMGHSELDRFLEEEAAKQGRYVCIDPNPENGMFYRSDQLPFLKAGVPALFAKGYSHQAELGKDSTLKAVADYWQTTYHKPSDEYNPAVHSLEGLRDDAELFFNLGLRLANSNYFPKWHKNSEFYRER